MVPTQRSDEEIARIAEEIYRRDVRPKVMPQHKGKFLVLDIESGDYAVDEDDYAAEQTLTARRPQGVFFVFRVGYTSAYSFGARLTEDEP
jgi:hypothetical protein